MVVIAPFEFFPPNSWFHISTPTHHSVACHSFLTTGHIVYLVMPTFCCLVCIKRAVTAYVSAVWKDSGAWFLLKSTAIMSVCLMINASVLNYFIGVIIPGESVSSTFGSNIITVNCGTSSQVQPPRM